MSISKIKYRNGTERFVTISISRGRNPLTGKQNTAYTERFFFKEEWSDERGIREATKKEGELTPQVREGKLLPKKERKELARQRLLKDKSRYTVNQLVDEFLKQKERTVKITTYLRYEEKLSEFANMYGSLLVEDITRSHIKDYFRAINPNNTLKQNTINHRLTILKQLFNYAETEEIVPRSIMQKIKLENIEVRIIKSAKPESFSEDEVRHIIEISESLPFKYKMFIRLAIDTGCRIGELCGLKWKSVDFDNQKIKIENNMQWADHQYRELSPKNGKSREIYVDPIVMNMLREYKVKDMEQCLRNGLPKSEFVFHSKDGTAMRTGTVRTYLKKLSQKHDIPNFKPHKLRHTCASLSIIHGVDPASISEKLGHSTPAFTLTVYSHATEESKKKASEIYSQALYKAVK